jgi:hypothetical protein
MVFWDGRNLSGQEVSSGVYFYQAKVNFYTHDPAAETQRVKGWVQVIR